MNEHLMEALRRLRRSSNDTNVDRRLVTNVLLSFLTTPRNDTKRFEMLSLLASILSWNDSEREKAGLQRARSSSGAGAGAWGRPASPKGKGAELEKGDETEVRRTTLETSLHLTLANTIVQFISLSPRCGSNSYSANHPPLPPASVPQPTVHHHAELRVEVHSSYRHLRHLLARRPPYPSRVRQHQVGRRLHPDSSGLQGCRRSLAWGWRRRSKGMWIDASLFSSEPRRRFHSFVQCLLISYFTVCF
jgi:hypothetical protein